MIAYLLFQNKLRILVAIFGTDLKYFCLSFNFLFPHENAINCVILNVSAMVGQCFLGSLYKLIDNSISNFVSSLDKILPDKYE